MAIELIFPPKAMQQGFPALLEQMNPSGLYIYKSEGKETRLEWSKMVGWGSVSFTCFRPGLQISVEDYQMKEDLIMQGQHSYADPLKFYFLLSGELNGIVGSPASSFQLKSGQNCLTACGSDRAASPEENRAQIIYQRDQAYLGVAVLTVGYTSFSRFSEAFKQHFGIPPKAYQKNFDISQLHSLCPNHNGN